MSAPFYVEFPVDPVVGVSWKKKKDDDGGPKPTGFDTCGAFQLGILHGLFAGFSGMYVLSYWGLYLVENNNDPHHLPNVPRRYYPMFLDYTWFMPWPYIWAGPESWTITIHSEASVFPSTLELYRDINPQVFEPGSPQVPPTTTGTTIEVKAIRFDEYYFPFFVARHANGTGVPYPTVLVQAHCCVDNPYNPENPTAPRCPEEITGTMWTGTDNDPATPGACMAMIPPQPDGWGTEIDPATLVPPPQGTTDWPVHGAPDNPPPRSIQRLTGKV